MTSHSIEALKRSARKICKSEGISHSQALTRLAQTHGYKNYEELQRQSTDGRFTSKTQ